MDAKEALRQEIAALKKQIDARQDALKALQKGESAAGIPSLRFFDWRPIDAIRVLLIERGQKMGRREIYDALLAGGIATGKKRAGHNIRISIEKNIELGNLIALEGKDEDFLDLPDRKDAFIEGEVIERPNRALPSPKK